MHASAQVVAQKAYLLHVDLDVLLQGVAVEVEHQVVDEVEAVAHDDERQLVRQLGLLRGEETSIRSRNRPEASPGLVRLLDTGSKKAFFGW